MGMIASHRKLKFVVAFAMLCLLALLGQAETAAKPAVALSAASIKNVVLSSDTLDPAYKQHVFAAYSGGVASVSLFRHPDATEADCKIDAVLMAQKIIALDPADIKLVHCIFYDFDRQNEFWEVELRAQLISAFAQGKIGEHELINSVLLKEGKQANPLSQKFAVLSYRGILDQDSVCHGAYEDRRLAIHLRLKELERQGMAVDQFREKYLRIEDAARRGKDADLSAQINSLSKTLDEHVQNLISTGQLAKPELRRSKNSLGEKGAPNVEPLMGTHNKQ